MTNIKAWHFTSATLRDGRPLPRPGATLVHDGKLVLCKSGLHASRRLIDALQYAPGSVLHRVTCGGTVIEAEDKLVCSERTIMWSADTDEMLLRFGRKCALEVAHLWDAPRCVVDFLRTGDSRLEDVARESARALVPAWAPGRTAKYAAALSAAKVATAGAGRATGIATAARYVALAVRLTADNPTGRDYTKTVSTSQNRRLTAMASRLPRIVSGQDR